MLMILFSLIEINGSSLHPEFGSGISITKGVSRSFCQLDRLGRPAPPAPPPPQLPFHGTMATRLQCTICSYKVLNALCISTVYFLHFVFYH